MVTAPDFSVPHTQFWLSLEEDPLGFTIHHPELIMLKNIKTYRHWSALIKIVPHWFFFNSYKNTLKSVLSNPEKYGLKVTCLMSLYSNLKKIPWKMRMLQHFSIPPPPLFEEKYLPHIEGFYYKLFCHYTCHCREYIGNHMMTIIHTDGNHTDGRPYCQ